MPCTKDTPADKNRTGNSLACLRFIACTENRANESRVLAEAEALPDTLKMIARRQHCYSAYPEGQGNDIVHTIENIAIHFEADKNEIKISVDVNLGAWPCRARDTVNTKSTLGVTPCARADVTSAPPEAAVDRMLFDVRQPRHIQTDRRRIDGSGDEFKSPLWRNRNIESKRESKIAVGPINWAEEGHPLGIKSPGELSDGDNEERFSRKRNIT
ncbi:hypothetical protein MferCBS49748_002430 [Microsporum ferrugineum]